MTLVQRPNFRDAIMNEVDYITYENSSFCARIPSRLIVQYTCSRSEYQSLVNEFFQIVDRTRFYELDEGWAKLTPLTFSSVRLDREASPLGLLRKVDVWLSTKTFGWSRWEFHGANAEADAIKKMLEIILFVFSDSIDEDGAEEMPAQAEERKPADAPTPTKDDGFKTVTGKKRRGKKGTGTGA